MYDLYRYIFGTMKCNSPFSFASNYFFMTHLNTSIFNVFVMQFVHSIEV